MRNKKKKLTLATMMLLTVFCLAGCFNKENPTPVKPATSTPVPTNTTAPTFTPTPTVTAAQTPVPTAANTQTPVPTATSTPTPTNTAVPTPTPCIHEFGNWEVTVPETESSDGLAERACRFCGEKETKAIPAHEHIMDMISSVESTCSSDGKLVFACIEKRYDIFTDSYVVCTYTEEEIIPRDEMMHDWSEWKTTKEAQPGKAGEMTRTCNICSAKDTKEIPALPKDAPKITFLTRFNYPYYLMDDAYDLDEYRKYEQYMYKDNETGETFTVDYYTLYYFGQREDPENVIRGYHIYPCAKVLEDCYVYESTTDRLDKTKLLTKGTSVQVTTIMFCSNGEIYYGVTYNEKNDPVKVSGVLPSELVSPMCADDEHVYIKEGKHCECEVCGTEFVTDSKCGNPIDVPGTAEGWGPVYKICPYCGQRYRYGEVVTIECETCGKRHSWITTFWDDPEWMWKDVATKEEMQEAYKHAHGLCAQ